MTKMIASYTQLVKVGELIDTAPENEGLTVEGRVWLAVLTQAYKDLKLIESKRTTSQYPSEDYWRVHRGLEDKEQFNKRHKRKLYLDIKLWATDSEIEVGSLAWIENEYDRFAPIVKRIKNKLLTVSKIYE